MVAVDRTSGTAEKNASGKQNKNKTTNITKNVGDLIGSDHSLWKRKNTTDTELWYEDEPGAPGRASDAAVGGATRSIARNALLALTRRASIGKLPIRARHVAKLSTTADAAMGIAESSSYAVKGSRAASASIRSKQAARFSYSFLRSALLGTVLFSSYDELVEQRILKVRPWNGLDLGPFLAGFGAGALHGLFEYGFERIEEAWARVHSKSRIVSNAALPSNKHFRLWPELRSLSAICSRNSLSHAALFGIYYNVFAHLGPSITDLSRDSGQIPQRDFLHSEDFEYGHLLFTTVIAGLVAGCSQEVINAAALRQLANFPDVRKAGLASAIGFLALEFARFDETTD